MRMRGFEIISKEQFNKDFDKDMEIEIKLPKRSTKKSAGYDVFAPFDIILKPNEDIKIPTGLRVYMQDGEFLAIVPRSGLGFKYYTRLANTLGIIDSDYVFSDNEGHIWVKLRNEGKKDLYIKQGDAFCQAIFMPFLLVDDDNFEDGEDRNGGFGSTTKERD